MHKDYLEYRHILNKRLNTLDMFIIKCMRADEYVSDMIDYRIKVLENRSMERTEFYANDLFKPNKI